MSENEVEFNNYLISSEVVGCAYGFEFVDAMDMHIPVISLIALHEDKIRKAFDCFQEWGCEEDGDIVSAEILLKNDGTYRLAIGPNVRRMMHKRIHHNQLVEPILFGVKWIKMVDSINPILSDWAVSSKSRFSPFKINAVTSSGGRKIPSADAITPVDGLPEIIKLNMKFSDEKHTPDHWLLKFEENRKRGKAPKEPLIAVAEARSRVINTAFPVSRDRVRRSGLIDSVKALKGMESITSSQIVQGALNIMLSMELCKGKLHYETMDQPEHAIWSYIGERIEKADGNDPTSSIDCEKVAEQISLDVAHLLRKLGVQIAQMKFSSQQNLFLRRGYGGA